MSQQKVNKDVKKLSHSVYTNARQKAKIDRERARKYKSPDVTKRYRAYIPSQRLEVFARSKAKLKHNVSELQKQKGFEMNEVIY